MGVPYLFTFYGRSIEYVIFFFFQAEDGIRDYKVTGVQTCALPISPSPAASRCATWTAARSWPPGRTPGRSAGWPGARKIGRASCRERVEISAVAVPLTAEPMEASMRGAIQ